MNPPDFLVHCSATAVSQCGRRLLPPPTHPPQIECDAIIGKQTRQKGWMESAIRFACSHPPLAKGPPRAPFYMMYRLSLVHISRGMILHFGKMIARLICDVAHFSSCNCGLQFVLSPCLLLAVYEMILPGCWTPCNETRMLFLGLLSGVM